jgi:hypothetical protein
MAPVSSERTRTVVSSRAQALAAVSMGIDINLLSPVYMRTLFIEKNEVCNGSKTGIIDAVH